MLGVIAPTWIFVCLHRGFRANARFQHWDWGEGVFQFGIFNSAYRLNVLFPRLKMSGTFVEHATWQSWFRFPLLEETHPPNNPAHRVEIRWGGMGDLILRPWAPKPFFEQSTELWKEIVHFLEACFSMKFQGVPGAALNFEALGFKTDSPPPFLTAKPSPQPFSNQPLVNN